MASIGPGGIEIQRRLRRSDAGREASIGPGGIEIRSKSAAIDSAYRLQSDRGELKSEVAAGDVTNAAGFNRTGGN